MSDIERTTPALSIRDVSVYFGGLAALADVSFDVVPSTRHGILGPNGAGKTTLFNVISGFITPKTGRVLMNGTDVTTLPAHRRIEHGLARTFQITTLFPELSALENVLMGSLVRVEHHRNPWQPARQDDEARAIAESLLAELGLEHLAGVPVREIGYGEQRQLEVAVALSTNPQLLLLDEPTAGLSAAETRGITDFVRRLPAELTVVLIEHDLDVIFDLADTLTVLYYGEVLANGPAGEVQNDPVVREAYLGGG